MRFGPMIPLALLALAATAAPLAAQATRLSVGAGRTVYDAGGDGSFALLRVAVDRRVAGPLRLGVAATRTHVGHYRGNPEWLVAPADSGNETLTRVVATANLSAGEVLRESGVPLLDRLAPWLEVNAGVAHSSGRAALAAPADDRTVRLTTAPTGLALGAGLGVDGRVTRHVGLRAGLMLWQDYLHGGSLTDQDSFVALALAF